MKKQQENRKITSLKLKNTLNKITITYQEDASNNNPRIDRSTNIVSKYTKGVVS